MKIDIEKAKKNLKTFKEDLGIAFAELADGIFIENAADDITIDTEISDKEDANKSKGKSVIHEAMEKCYYSVLATIAEAKLAYQEKKKEKLSEKQEKELNRVEKNAEKSGLDLLDEQVIKNKVEVYQKGQEQIDNLNSAIDKTKQDFETYKQKISDIDNHVLSSDELNSTDMDILNKTSEMEPVATQISPMEEKIEKQIETETSQQIGEEVQNITNEIESSQQNQEEIQTMANETDISQQNQEEISIKSVSAQEKKSSKEQLRNAEIETIVTSLNAEIEDIYKKLNNKINETYETLNNEVNSSYEQITSKTQAAMKKLEQLKENHRKQDIKIMAEQSENMIRSAGTKLAKAEAKQTETTANLKKAEDTVVTQENNIKDMQSQISSLNETISTKDKEIEALRRELTIQEQKNSELTNKNKRLAVTVATLKELDENPEQDINMDGLLPDENQVDSKKTK